MVNTQLQLAVPLDEDAKPEVRVRRLRAGVQLSLDDDRVRTKVELNLAPRSLELIEAWGERQYGLARLRLGILKIPFTTYRDTSSRDLALAEWSPVTRAFGSERQVGGMLLVGTGDGWHGALAVTQGQSTRTSHGQGAADLHEAEPCAWAALDGPECALEGVAPELSGRVGWTAADLNDFEPSEGLRGAWAVSAAVDTQPVAERDLGARLAVEGTARLNRVGLQVGVYGATVERDERWPPGLVGGRMELSWVAHEHLMLAARTSWVEALGVNQTWRCGETVVGATVPVVGQAVRVQLDGGVLVGPKPGEPTGGVIRMMLQAGA